MKRIGLTQRVQVVAGHGERRDCLDQRLAGFLLSLGYCPIPLANEAQDVERYLTALSLDGVVLTGGNDLVEADGGTDVAPERDRFEHLALDFCTANRLPVLGVCRGLQLMNVHYGGAISHVKNHVARPHLVKLDPDHFPGCSISIAVNSFHQFGIDNSGISSELKAIAWAEDGTIEAATHIRFSHSGVMWHPERAESLTQHDLLMIRTLFGESS